MKLACNFQILHQHSDKSEVSADELLQAKLSISLTYLADGMKVRTCHSLTCIIIGFADNC